MTHEPPRGRSVARVVPAIRTVEGGGFVVHRPFPTRDLDAVDPFLLLDEMGPVDYASGEALGAPEHPHRGFETVTYLLAGAMEHRDSAGNSGRLGPGDVQWMTAGGGVLHSELPAADFKRTGGRMHGFQLWVNLPRAEKRIAPRYQEIPAAGIPEASAPGVRVRVLAGESLGEKAVIETRTPILYLDVSLDAGTRFTQPVPPDFNLFAYVVEGSGRFGAGATAARRHDLVLFAPGSEDASAATVEAEEAMRVLLLGGRPLREPIARYGPFVMSTRAELMEAVDDFQSGRFGEIPASG